MAEHVEPPFATWTDVLAGSPGLVDSLTSIHTSQYSGSPRNVADMGFDLLTAASSFGRSLYQVEWPPRPIERESLSTTGELLTVTAGEALIATVRFREANTEIRTKPADWGPLLDSLAQPPRVHFYWLGRRWPLHAFAYSLWSHLHGSGRELGELIELGSESAGDAVLSSGADLTALGLTLPSALALGLDTTYPGRGGEPYSAS